MSKYYHPPSIAECKKPAQAVSSRSTASAECQTVMTLINCPYVSLPSASDNEKHPPATSVAHPAAPTYPEQVPPAISASTQTESETDLKVITATVSDIVVPVITAKCESIAKPGILKSSPNTVTRARTVKEDSRTDSSVSGASTDSPRSGAAEKRYSYQEWIDREPKPPRFDTSRTASFDISDISQSSKMSSQSSDEVFASK